MLCNNTKGIKTVKDNASKTIMFSVRDQEEILMRQTLQGVYNSLKEKGYDPINQLVGYLLSGDPTYITSYGNARYLIRQLERDELLEELVRSYVLDLDQE